MKLEIRPTARDRMEDAPDFAQKFAVLAWELVKAAAMLDSLNGFEKHTLVVDHLTAEFIGDPADEEAYEEFLDELLDLKGFAEVASDIAIDLLPIKRLAEAQIAAGVRTAYRILKDTGAIG